MMPYLFSLITVPCESSTCRLVKVFLLVYSITLRNLFKEIITFHQQILHMKDKDLFPVIIVANKCDLEFERQVGMNGTST